MVYQKKIHLGPVIQLSIIRAFLKPLRIPILALFFVTVIGVCGYMLIDDFNFSDALYMTVITEATVGFGEINPLSPEGRYFTIFLIFLSFIVFAFAVTSITSYILSGNYKKSISQQKQFKLMKNITGHTIICGFGRGGSQALEELQKENIECIIIERNESLIPDENDHFICGDATTDEILTKAGIEKAANLIIALPSDSDNLMIVVSAHALNPKLSIVVKVSHKTNEKKMLNAGANHIISPDTVGGTAMARMVSKPDLMEFIDCLTNLDVKEITIDEVIYNHPSGKSKKIKEFENSLLAGCRIVGYKNKNGGFIINPADDTEIEPETKLFILGKSEQILKLHQNFNQ